MSKSRLDRLPDIVVSETHMHSTTSDVNSDDPPRRLLRSHTLVYVKDNHCVICCSGVENGELNRAMTFNTHEKLQTLSSRDPLLMVRLQNAFDPIAADILYHPMCLLRRQSASDDTDQVPVNQVSGHDIVYTKLKHEIISRTSRGQAVLVSECWERFSDMCWEHSLPVPYYYKVRRKFFLNKIIELVPHVIVIPRQSADVEDDLIIS